jgi:hypothetical protein
MKLIHLPSGESWEPLISGSPKKSSRSSRGAGVMATFSWLAASSSPPLQPKRAGRASRAMEIKRIRFM